MPVSKKATTLLPEQFIKFLIGVVVVAIMVLLLFSMYKLFVPSYDKENEVSKAYLDLFKKEIEKADNGGIGKFYIWQVEPETQYVFVYFGNNRTKKVQFMDGSEQIWAYGGIPKNTVCICWYNKDKQYCNQCINLNREAKYARGYYGYNHVFYIKNEESNYYFLERPEDIGVVRDLINVGKFLDEIKNPESSTGKIYWIARSIDDSNIGYDLFFKFEEKWKFVFLGDGEKFTNSNWNDATAEIVKALSIPMLQRSPDPSLTIKKHASTISSLESKNFLDGKKILEEAGGRLYVQ